jgi:DNA-binding NarL/FixJ family response regulator
MPKELRVLIVDDHPVFRRGLRDVIAENPQCKIVGEAADGQEALQLLTELKPRIAIVDIDMPRLNGLDMMRVLRKTETAVAIIFLTMYRDEQMFNAAMDLGVKAYVLKENAAADILAALKKVAEGEMFVSPSMSQMRERRTDRVHEMLLSKPQIDELTPAERHILKLIAEDRTSKEIADFLQISVKTVENHRLNICHKLNLHGSHSLLKFAFDHKSYL